MRRKLTLPFLFVIILLAVGSTADEPQKRVMKFIAVIDIQCGEGVNKNLSAPLTNVIIDELVKIGTYTVIDRANRDKILSEQGFQQTCHVGECVVEMGRLLGVGKIVVGNIDLVGSAYLINLQLINVETAAVENSVNKKCKCDEEGLIDAIRGAAAELFRQIPNETAAPIARSENSKIESVTREMVMVSAGEFGMGCNELVDNQCDADERPYHKVYLDAFSIDKYEVTNEAYLKCVDAGRCSPSDKYGGFNNPQQPVVGVTWFQADAYCSWAGMRLPTEAEWEKAARGTEGKKYPSGNAIDCSKANYRECKYGKTMNVGSYPSGASPYGAMDMDGNVWEWVADWYRGDYYKVEQTRNPKGPASGRSKVIRGGGWNDGSPKYLRVSNREKYESNYRNNDLGFRCVRTQ